MLDKPIASELLTLIDDGTRPRGLASRPFDRGRVLSYLQGRLSLETDAGACTPNQPVPSTSTPTSLKFGTSGNAAARPLPTARGAARR